MANTIFAPIATMLLFALQLLSFSPHAAVRAFEGCKGISCGIDGCCNPSTQRCVTPPGFGGSYCTSLSSGRRLVDGNADMWTKNIRVGFVNILSVNSKNVTIKDVAETLSDRVVNVTILQFYSASDDVASIGFFKPGRVLSVILIGARAFAKDHASALDRASTVAKKKKHLTGIAFCPIANKNIIALRVRINDSSDVTITSANKAQKRALAKLSKLELDVVVGKRDVVDAHTYDWAAVVANSA